MPTTPHHLNTHEIGDVLYHPTTLNTTTKGGGNNIMKSGSGEMHIAIQGNIITTTMTMMTLKPMIGLTLTTTIHGGRTKNRITRGDGERTCGR